MPQINTDFFYRSIIRTKNNFRFSLSRCGGILAASFILFSCKDVIQVKLEKGDTLLVVDAFVNNKPGTQTVRLTFTSDYFSTTSTPPVLGATVNLQDLTNSKTYNFIADGNGNYLYTPLVNDSMAQVNHNYRLNVVYNGSTYISTTKLNRTAHIDTIVFENSRRGFDNSADTTDPRQFYPYLKAHDAPFGLDYYWIKTYVNSVYNNDPRQLNVSQDGGGDHTDGISFIPPVAFFNLVSKPLYRQDICTIEIHSITADAYDFLSQMQAQMTNAEAGLFAVTPQNVKTNISMSSGSGIKAIGWFSMSAVTSKTVVAGN